MLGYSYIYMLTILIHYSMYIYILTILIYYSMYIYKYIIVLYYILYNIINYIYRVYTIYYIHTVYTHSICVSIHPLKNFCRHLWGEGMAELLHVRAMLQFLAAEGRLGSSQNIHHVDPCCM